MTKEKQYQLQKVYAEANREMLRMSQGGPRGQGRGRRERSGLDGRRDALIGEQSRQGVRHALRALCLARGLEYEDAWSTRRLLQGADPGHKLNIGAGILDQYPDGGGMPQPEAPNPITTIPDHIFMVCADISMILEVADQRLALMSTG